MTAVPAAPPPPADAVTGAAAGPPLAEVALVGSIVAFHVVDHRRIPERYHLWSHLGAGAAAVAAAWRLGASADDLGLGRGRVGSGLRHGVVVSAAVAAVTVAAAQVPAVRHALDDPRAAGLSRRELARRLGVEIPWGTAAYEELVFRSALLGLARRRWSDPVAVAVTSALFGLWHVLPAIEDRNHNPLAARHHPVATVLPTVVSTMAAGVGFGVLRLRSGSVIAPMLVHAAANAAGLAVAAAAARRAP